MKKKPFASNAKKKPQDQSYKQFKKVGIMHGVQLKKGKWQVEKEAKKKARVPGEPKKKQQGGEPYVQTPENIGNAIVLSKASGKSWDQVAEEMGQSKVHVAKKAREHFINNQEGKQILKSVLLENAIAFGSQAGEKIEELNGMQSVVAAGIMTQRFVDLDKHDQNSNQTIDLEEVAKAGRLIEQLEQQIPIEATGIPEDVIDLT